MPPRHSQFSVARMTGPVSGLGPAKSYARESVVVPKKADCLDMISSRMSLASGFPLATSRQHGAGRDTAKLMTAATHLLSLSG